MPAAAVAQSTTGNVQIGQYQPTPFSDRYLRLDGPGVLPFGQLRVGMDVDYALRPLVLVEASPGIFRLGTSLDHNIIEHAVGGVLLASFGLGHRLEAGIAVPLTLLQSGQTVAGAIEPSLVGVGNVRVGLKAALIDWHGVGAGAAIVAAVPGGLGTLTHEDGLGGEGRLFGGYRRGPLTVDGRAGFRLRRQQTFYGIALGNELTFAAGVSVRVGTRATALVELAGATAAGNPFGNTRQSPAEVLVGARQRIGKTWLTLAGGPGLAQGYGSPVFRVVAGFTWANQPPDADGDGVPDDDDRCPMVPEDRDGFQDADGCPDPDNDNDGIPDATDRCPNQPEDKDGFEDLDGCPDPDNDKDGIPDAADKCPNQPETVNDFEDDDGCPDQSPPASDKDKDGIPDEADECPEEAEDKDGFEDEDGCPDPDNDKDGIPDVTDKCPLQPETINGIDDDDGCPDKGQAKVRLGKTEIETLQPIYFDTDRSRVRHAFYNILGQIASLLKAHSEIGRCAIEGHTDDTGPPDWNQKLSVLRAEAVIEFLADKGVDPKRLVAIGHGEQVPWASNQTPWGRAKNRRVVFHIEGANAAEQKKQEQRLERRRHIRHRRDRLQQRKDDARDEGEKGHDTGTTKAPAALSPTERNPRPKSSPPSPRPPAPAETATAPGSKPDAEGVKTSGKASEKTPAKPPGASPSDVPAGPSPKSGAAAQGKISPKESPDRKPAPLEKPLEKMGSARTPEKSTDPRAKTTPSATPEHAPATSRKRSGPPDAGSGAPPTLRELLALPPR
jgi:outer membrane protein OmpA-like peptidoglycan-associated protein